ncbi:MAG: hypothetical protein WDN66_02565 [Candidatus Saccharibacteria bacterium]
MIGTGELAQDFVCEVDRAIEFSQVADVVRVEDDTFKGSMVVHNAGLMAVGAMTETEIRRTSPLQHRPLEGGEFVWMVGLGTEHPLEDVSFLVGENNPGKILRMRNIGSTSVFNALEPDEASKLLQWMNKGAERTKTVANLGQDSRERWLLSKANREVQAQTQAHGGNGTRKHGGSSSRSGRRGWRTLPIHRR